MYALWYLPASPERERCPCSKHYLSAQAPVILSLHSQAKEEWISFDVSKIVPGKYQTWRVLWCDTAWCFENYSDCKRPLPPREKLKLWGMAAVRCRSISVGSNKTYRNSNQDDFEVAIRRLLDNEWVQLKWSISARHDRCWLMDALTRFNQRRLLDNEWVLLKWQNRCCLIRRPNKVLANRFTFQDWYPRAQISCCIPPHLTLHRPLFFDRAAGFLIIIWNQSAVIVVMLKWLLS